MINFHRGSCKMELLRNFLVFCVCIVAANAQAKFYVLSSTSTSLSFEGKSKLKSGEVGAVALASTGLTIADSGTWNALYIKDPFDLPTLAVVVHIEGAPKIAFKSTKHTFESEGNAASASLTNVVKTVASAACDVNFNKNDDAVEAMNQCFPEIVVREFTSVDGLNADIAEDKAVLDAVAGINAMADAAGALTSNAEILIVRFSLQAFKKVHETEQASIDAAVTALQIALEKFQTDFVAEKGSKVAMFAIVTEGAAEDPTTDPPTTHTTDDTTTEAGEGEGEGEQENPESEGDEATMEKDTNANESGESLKRKKRDAVEGSTTNTYNLAVYYDQDYPVIFNIILWFMVTFGFSLLAICYAIGDMDPGRDSIIYRMTSTRMKKDN